MPNLASNNLRPGMLLTKDVTNMHGHLLLPAGHPLQEKDRFLLSAWGIKQVEVAEDGRPAPPDPNEERRTEIENQLRPVFVRQDFSQPIVRELLRACVDIRVQTEGAV